LHFFESGSPRPYASEIETIMDLHGGSLEGVEIVKRTSEGFEVLSTQEVNKEDRGG
jgi:hypothetical protein